MAAMAANIQLALKSTGFPTRISTRTLIRPMTLLLLPLILGLLITISGVHSEANNIEQFEVVEVEGVKGVPVYQTMPSTFPRHWGQPPLAQTRDLVPLPGDYGRGSSTLKSWILKNMAEDDARRDSGGNDNVETWPEKSLVGLTGEQAKLEILSSPLSKHEGVREDSIHILPEDAMVTMDYRTDRVRIFVNKDGLVARQPRLG